MDEKAPSFYKKGDLVYSLAGKNFSSLVLILESPVRFKCSCEFPECFCSNRVYVADCMNVKHSWVEKKFIFRSCKNSKL